MRSRIHLVDISAKLTLHLGATMHTQPRARAIFIVAICLRFAFSVPAQAQAQSAPQKENVVTKHATGTFEVKVTPQTADDNSQDATLGRMSLDKQFHGDLQGVGKGQMLTAGTAVKGSAGYVAIERVSGTLQGRTGTFILQHTGTMTRGALQLSITVVPDSGTDQLAGLAGTLTITVADGKHSYDFTYTLPKTP
jgi:Protein of unknown function (DUF3224)